MPEKIYVEEAAADLPMTQRVLDRCSGVSAQTVGSVRDLVRSTQTDAGPKFYKNRLLLCKNRGRFIEACPGTRRYLCCRYAILVMGTGCPLDCSYCVLQAYLNNPFITLYVNSDDMMNELNAHKPLQDGGLVRLGTGEYMDSLALEHLTDFTAYALPFFRKHPGVILELKTKTAHIEPLLDLDPAGAYIVSWSLNAEWAANREELGAAPVDRRIEAARRLVEKGYRVGFHFDPLICFRGWEDGYAQVIKKLGEAIPASSIVWISIGSLRYMPSLKTIAQDRFPGTDLYAQEFVPGLDGKMRYLQKIRLEMYAQVVSLLKQNLGNDVFIYYCMESPVVWRKTLGFAPESNNHLKKLLDHRIG